MQVTEGKSKTSASEDSQTGRTLVNLRGMLLRGDFQAGERISELPLVARLGVSRTPIRLALDRLAHEGLLDLEWRFEFAEKRTVGVPTGSKAVHAAGESTNSPRPKARRHLNTWFAFSP